MKKSVNRINILLTILSLLTIVFIVLKITNVIDWSLFWVFSPFTLPILIIIGIIIVLMFMKSLK